MDKRYQVFVSSTYEDLREERAEVIQALLELDCIPSGMELFPAADDDQWTTIKRVIDDCDYYICVIAGRFGSVGLEGKSYTQMEYEYALSQGKPIIAFLHADPGKIPADKTDPENRQALEAFRELARRKMCKTWSTAADLGSVVSRSIVKLIKDKPAIGWVRADAVPDESAAQEILKLRNRVHDLEKSIEEITVTAPEGAETLAQGDEEITLHYLFGDDDHQDYCFTWNEVFSALGPMMLTPVREEQMADKLCELYRNRAWDIGKFETPYISLRDEDFHRVKLQLRALGLIARVTFPATPTVPHWVLTPHGERQLLQVAAIPSAKESAKTIV